MYFAFRLLQQQTGEKLSDYLRRLDQSLNRVVQRGGLHSAEVDGARLDQLLRGAVSSDLMLVNLRLRERKLIPPTFLQLLKEIREEEEYEASRKKICPVVQRAYVKQDSDVKQSELQSLKSEIKELKSLVAAAVSKPAPATLGSAEKTPKTVPSEYGADSELTALKQEVKRLQQKVTQKVSEPQAAVSAVNALKPVASSPQRSAKRSDE